MELAVFKEALHEMLAEGVASLLPNYFEALAGPGATIEDKRKAIDMAARIVGAEADKKADPNAGLATFNFVFNNGAMQATPVLEVVEEVPMLTEQNRELLRTMEAELGSSGELSPELVEGLSDLDAMLANIGSKLGRY